MTDIRFTVSIPQELKDLVDWLDAQAEQQHRSRNRQIIHILQELKAQDDVKNDMRDERWLDMQARKFPPGDRIG